MDKSSILHKFISRNPVIKFCWATKFDAHKRFCLDFSKLSWSGFFGSVRNLLQLPGWNLPSTFPWAKFLTRYTAPSEVFPLLSILYTSVGHPWVNPLSRVEGSFSNFFVQNYQFQRRFQGAAWIDEFSMFTNSTSKFICSFVGNSIGYMKSKGTIRTLVVSFHQLMDDIHPLLGLLLFEIPKQFYSDHSVQSLHLSSFIVGLICGKKMNIASFQKNLHVSVVEFYSQICLQLFWHRSTSFRDCAWSRGNIHDRLVL